MSKQCKRFDPLGEVVLHGQYPRKALSACRMRTRDIDGDQLPRLTACDRLERSSVRYLPSFIPGALNTSGEDSPHVCGPSHPVCPRLDCILGPCTTHHATSAVSPSATSRHPYLFDNADDT